MILDALLGINKGDPLVPHFYFKRDQYANLDTNVFEQICTLRYEVYCLECGFLDPEEYKQGKETDNFDDASMHVAAYNLDNDIVGTVRLVLADSEDKVFPWEEHCYPFEDYVLPPKAKCGEVSRLVVRKQYRRRAGDTLEGIPKEISEAKGNVTIQAEPAQNLKKKRRGNTPQILLGLYREMYRYSRQNGVRYWYAAMEKHLAQSLFKMGFPFKPVGPEVDYYGPVTPYMADLDELRETLGKANPLLCAWFNDEPISRWMMLKAAIRYAIQSVLRR